MTDTIEALHKLRAEGRLEDIQAWIERTILQYGKSYDQVKIGSIYLEPVAAPYNPSVDDGTPEGRMNALAAHSTISLSFMLGYCAGTKYDPDLAMRYELVYRVLDAMRSAYRLTFNIGYEPPGLPYFVVKVDSDPDHHIRIDCVERVTH
jgi:hypothetical protein